MTLAVNCPGCKATLRVKDDLAGKKVKCPRCEAVVPVPAEEPDEVGIVEEAPARRPAAKAKTRACPECGKQIDVAAKKCRYCKTWLEEEEEEEERDEDERDEEEDRPRSRWKPCPRCDARGARRVTWTPWGSFYGPALFSHVRCRECGYAYNGRTGGSNLHWAIIFVMVPLILILGIVGGVVYLLHSKGYF